jgi:sugar phosphate isomerase/epimerase
MTEKQLPVVGAAMAVQELPEHIDWLLAEQRDLEIQDSCLTPIYDGEWSHLEIADGYASRLMRADWREIVRRAKDVLDGYEGRLSIHGPFVGMPLLTIDRKIRDVVRERLKQALAFAHELGATQMVLHSPWEFFGGPFLPHSSARDRDTVIGLVVDLLEHVLPVAEQANCALVIEDIQDRNPDPLLALVRAFESEYVRMSLDTGHAYIMHCQGGPPPDYWVRRAEAMLVHLHLQDGDGQVDRHWAPGRGSINWYALFEALEESDEMPRLILEVRHIREGAAWLAREGYTR